MKIYTKSGDDGTTGLFGGGRVRKDAPRVTAYGTIDELNAAIGCVRARAGFGTEITADASAAGEGSGSDGLVNIDALLCRIQSDLFEVGADLATPPGVRAQSVVRRVETGDAGSLEEAIDRLDTELSPQTSFILPGGTQLAADLHFARAVCRRAEREVVALDEVEPVGDGVRIFLNRLSDLLYVMARVSNRRAGHADVPWHPRGR